MSVAILSFPCRNRIAPPSPVRIPQDSNVEMKWRVFGGEISDILLLALKQRFYNDGLDTEWYWLSSRRSEYQENLRFNCHRYKQSEILILQC